VAGTIYEAIHHAVFSTILLLSAIKVLGQNNTVPSLHSILKVSDEMSDPHFCKF